MRLDENIESEEENGKRKSMSTLNVFSDKHLRKGDIGKRSVFCSIVFSSDLFVEKLKQKSNQ